MNLQPDFRELFEATPDAYLVVEPLDLTIVAVSAAYLRATMTTRASIVGRHLFEVFPDDPTEMDADGVANLRASLRRVVAEKRPHQMAVQRYPIRKDSGEFEERFWSPLNVPVVDASGVLTYIIHRVEDVTHVVRMERDRAERELSMKKMTALSDRYSDLLDNAPAGMIVVGEDGLIQIANAHVEDLFGYEPEELVGRPFELLVPERFRKLHGEHVARYFAAPCPRPMGADLELFGRRKDASEIPVEISLHPQDDDGVRSVSVTIRDVRERKHLETVARLTAERLAAAVAGIQDAFALFDADNRLLLCNAAFRALVRDGTTGTVVGRSYAQIFANWANEMAFADDAASEKFRADRATTCANDTSETFDVRLRDGRSLRVTNRRTAEGGFVETIWDLTDDEDRARELEEARKSAEAASAAKTEFLSSMSHELRTPLNAILGFAQLLELDRKEPLSDRHKLRVGEILRGGEHLLRLIDDILDLSRIEAGTVAVSPEPVNVEEILGEVTRTVEPLAKRYCVTIERAPLPATPPTVFADRTRFAQVLINFATNGIKYNRTDGTVRFTVDRVTPGFVRVTVEDTGVGIPSEKQDKLFQPFQRVGQEAGPIEGTGIGLVITRRLVALMGGTIGFQSDAGRGSSFWVDLPEHVTKTATESGSDPSAAARAAIEHRKWRPRSVLYVEDNPANVAFMRDLMSSLEDVTLLVAPTAELGIELARARRPDLVIMDINLPGMSGLEALGVLRTDPATTKIPVIALTAAASERDRKRGLEAGFYRYLTKPLRVEEFVSTVEDLFAE